MIASHYDKARKPWPPHMPNWLFPDHAGRVSDNSRKTLYRYDFPTFMISPYRWYWLLDFDYWHLHLFLTAKRLLQAVIESHHPINFLHRTVSSQRLHLSCPESQAAPQGLTASFVLSASMTAIVLRTWSLAPTHTRFSRSLTPPYFARGE